MLLFLLCGAIAGALMTWGFLRFRAFQRPAALPATVNDKALSALASGTAHDINNALAPARLSLELLRDTEGTDPELLGLVTRGVERCIRLAERLTRYAEADHTGDDRIAAEALLDAVRLTLPAQTGLRVTLSVEPGLPDLVGSREQLHALLRELALNAVHAMPEGGQLTLSAGLCDDDHAGSSATGSPGARGGLKPTGVAFSISDTGAGLSPEALAAARRPFVTTGEKQGGSGLGLSIAERIALAHGGFIDLSSTPGAGTTATAWIPVIDQATA
ncbi:MAG: ATP-binding protein [Pseudomonadales bacterium]